MLTLAALRHLAGAYGADLARWPEAQRAEAQALLAASAEARALLRKEAVLDTVLANLALPEPDEADLARLRAGIAAKFSIPPRRRNWVPMLPRWGWLTAGASGALTAGLLVGLLSAAPPANTGLLAMLQPSALPVLAD